jgi:hypothetical protein
MDSSTYQVQTGQETKENHLRCRILPGYSKTQPHQHQIEEWMGNKEQRWQVITFHVPGSLQAFVGKSLDCFALGQFLNLQKSVEFFQGLPPVACLAVLFPYIAVKSGTWFHLYHFASWWFSIGILSALFFLSRTRNKCFCALFVNKAAAF